MSSRVRQVARGLGKLALALLGATVAWLVVLKVRAEKRPEPLYTEASLPALPAPGMNGWVLAQELPASGAPPPLTRLIDPGTTTAGDWAAVEREAPALRAFMASAPAQQTLSAFEAAIDRPLFADACPVGLFSHCAVLPLHRAHQVEELAILTRALDAPDEAAARLARMMRADAGWLGSSRSMLSFQVALTGARRSVAVATMLAPRVSSPARAALASAVEAMRKAPLDLMRPLIVQYLHGLAAIEAVDADARALLLSGPTTPAPRPLGHVISVVGLDRGRTERLLAERTRAWADWLRQPVTSAPPPVVMYADQPLSWLDNPIGKETLDLLQMQPSIWPKARLGISALEGESEALVAALR